MDEDKNHSSSVVLQNSDTALNPKASNQHNRARSAVIQSRNKTAALDTRSENSEIKKRPFMITSVQTKRKTSPNNVIKEYQENVISKIKFNKHNSAEKLEQKPFIVASINTKRKVSSRKDAWGNEISEDEIFMNNDNSMHRITITKIEKQKSVLSKTSGFDNNNQMENLIPCLDNDELNEKIEKKLKKLEKDLTKAMGGKPSISEEVEYNEIYNDRDKE